MTRAMVTMMPMAWTAFMVVQAATMAAAIAICSLLTSVLFTGIADWCWHHAACGTCIVIAPGDSTVAQQNTACR